MKRNHYKPIKPPWWVLKFVKENYAYEEYHNQAYIFSIRSKKYIGSINNGCNVRDGYSRVRIVYKSYDKFHKFHHLVFFLNAGRWPIDSVDHKDDNRFNNVYSNLQELNHLDNLKKRKFK